MTFIHGGGIGPKPIPAETLVNDVVRLFQWANWQTEHIDRLEKRIKKLEKKVKR